MTLSTTTSSLLFLWAVVAGVLMWHNCAAEEIILHISTR